MNFVALLSFQPRFRFALRWILERLVESGCAEARNDGESPLLSSATTRRGSPISKRLRAMGLSIDPANAATLDLLDHAASLYPAVASGRARVVITACSDRKEYRCG